MNIAPATAIATELPGRGSQKMTLRARLNQLRLKLAENLPRVCARPRAVAGDGARGQTGAFEWQGGAIHRA